jgi:N-acetylglutamate synthase-like GNAT family acetyltransferase
VATATPTGSHDRVFDYAIDAAKINRNQVRQPPSYYYHNCAFGYRPMHLRAAAIDDLPHLNDLMFRSKAVWGYDAAFMDACREELTIRRRDLQATAIMVAEDGDGITGVAQVEINGDQAELLNLYVEPARLGGGIGRRLFAWAVEHARQAGAGQLMIDADPNAAPFYRSVGAADIGFSPSGSIPGRSLPRLAVTL